MTEVLPVTDVTVAEIDEAGDGDGVLVGHPLPGVDVRVSAVDDDGRATGPLTDEAGVLGEIVVRAAHKKDRYDRLWATERASSRDPGWHRTGDVGRLDADGRLWIGGRLGHVITTPEGPLAPVRIEQAVQQLPAVRQAACVGVGPRGTQAVVVIVVADDAPEGLADLAADRCRARLLPASTSPPSSCVASCPSTSGTARRSTGRRWRTGPRRGSPAGPDGAPRHEGARHRRPGLLGSAVVRELASRGHDVTELPALDGGPRARVSARCWATSPIRLAVAARSGRAGRRRPPGGAGLDGRPVGGVRAGQRRGHAHRRSMPRRGGRRGADGPGVVAVGRARGGAARGSAGGRGRPCPCARQLRAEQGAWPSCWPWPPTRPASP